MFAGCRIVGQCAQNDGFVARSWEINEHPVKGDLCHPRTRRALVRDIMQGLVLAAMLAPPCGSFSVARNRTSVIRTRKEPWGITFRPLNAKEAAALEQGNATARAALGFIAVLQQCKVPWCLEHPLTSYLWKTPEVMALLNKS